MSIWNCFTITLLTVNYELKLAIERFMYSYEK